MRITPEMERAVQEPGFRDAYLTWTQNPVTRRMLSLIPSPTGLHDMKAEAALYYAGGVDMAEQITDLLTCLVSEVDRIVEARQAGRGLAADYGAGPKPGAPNAREPRA